MSNVREWWQREWRMSIMGERCLVVNRVIVRGYWIWRGPVPSSVTQATSGSNGMKMRVEVVGVDLI